LIRTGKMHFARLFAGRFFYDIFCNAKSAKRRFFAQETWKNVLS